MPVQLADAAGALLLAHARLWMPLLPVLLTGGVALVARRSVQDHVDLARITIRRHRTR